MIASASNTACEENTTAPLEAYGEDPVAHRDGLEDPVRRRRGQADGVAVDDGLRDDRGTGLAVQARHAAV
ncbi:hypothetical protein QP157_21540 [Sphingomonas sp. LR61]|uniref:hypothetical protein n=1 Tax=Sphingomonas sp. LR61 TaxID=3050234 RepID=UPI002FE1EB48